MNDYLESIIILSSAVVASQAGGFLGLNYVAYNESKFDYKHNKPENQTAENFIENKEKGFTEITKKRNYIWGIYFAEKYIERKEGRSLKWNY